MAELPIMNQNKKEVLYQLGVINEQMGETEKAGTYFKEVYQVDIGYKDIAQRVEKHYDDKRDTSA